jgi:hypothetical protein
MPLAFMEDFRRGWARGRAVEAPARVPAAGNDAETENISSLAEVTALAEQLQTRIEELEAEIASSPAAIYAEVLRLPGVKVWLTKRFHPDKPDVKDDEREWLTARMQKVNAAYEALEKEGR